jgi:hypothetical protein
MLAFNTRKGGHMVMQLRAARVLFLTVILVAMMSCAKKETVQPAETTADTAAQTAEAPPVETAATVPAEQAVTAPPPAGAAVATTDGEAPGVRIDINELKRDAAGTVTMKLTFVNGGTKNHEFGYDYGDPARTNDYGSIGGIHLLDGANRQKYDVMHDADDNCVCSRKIGKIEPGSQSKVWAKFTAPPEGVNAVTVVVPHFIPMENVPISN